MGTYRIKAERWDKDSKSYFECTLEVYVDEDHKFEYVREIKHDEL